VTASVQTSDDPLAPILLRAISVGALLGAVAAISLGLAASSAGLLVYGPIGGAWVGALVGGANGIGLFLAMNRTPSRSVARVVAALGCAISAGGLVAAAGAVDTAAGLTIVGACVVAGAIVGPFVAFGRRALVVIPVIKIAVFGALAGLGLGGLAGLILGFVTESGWFIPFAPLLGGLLCVVPATLVALLVTVPIIWVRRHLHESD
jgi:hypothetical protein